MSFHECGYSLLFHQLMKLSIWVYYCSSVGAVWHSSPIDLDQAPNIRLFGLLQADQDPSIRYWSVSTGQCQMLSIDRQRCLLISVWFNREPEVIRSKVGGRGRCMKLKTVTEIGQNSTHDKFTAESVFLYWVHMRWGAEFASIFWEKESVS